MFDVGFWELAILGVLGLLILGPERLPKAARTIGAYTRKARQSWSRIHAEIERELESKEIRQALDQSREQVNEIGKGISDGAKQFGDELKQVSDEQRERKSDRSE